MTYILTLDGADIKAVPSAKISSKRNATVVDDSDDNYFYFGFESEEIIERQNRETAVTARYALSENEDFDSVWQNRNNINYA